MERKRSITLLASIVMMVILAATALLAGCSSSSPTTTVPPTSSAPAATTQPVQTQPGAQTSSGNSQILIGVVNSMSGNNAMDGAEQKWAYEQAVSDINAAGGVNVGGTKMPIKLVFEDDQSTNDGAASAMEKLVKVDNVKLVLGTNIDKANNAAATVADKYQVYYAGSGGWWGDDFESQHFQWASDIFFTSVDAATTPFEIWNNQPADQRPTKIALMYMNIPDGTIFGQSVLDAAKKYNYNIVDNDPYTQGSVDFSSDILKIKSSGADALLWLGAPTDGITLIKGIKAANLNLKYIQGWMGFWPTQFEQALGADSNYIVHDAFWAASLPYPGNQQLDKEFRAAHNGDDSVTIGIYYASVQVLAQAIEKAGSTDPAKVKDAVYGGTFKGTTMGDLTFKSDGYCETPALALQWWNGQREPVWPAFPSVWNLKWMPPWNQR